MKYLVLTFFFLTHVLAVAAKPKIDPKSVVILYNSNMPESKDLAEYYATKREIPAVNLIGLPMAKSGKISREQYITSIQDPLREHFNTKGWWKLGTSTDGVKAAVQNKVKVIVCMYGVPYGVNQLAPPPQPDGKAAKGPINCAAVDSELAILSVHDFPIGKAIQNQYFRKDVSFAEAKLPFYMLVGRIDAPTIEICRRMIDDAIEIEKTGLWGMAYLDLAYKGNAYKLGDDWIRSIEKTNWKYGIPTIIDKNRDTYLTNYPMMDVAMYFGWYTGNVNGPFRNPKFRFKKGAVAVHLHSFSASNLRNPNTKWVGPLLARGAAATVGNVYEPYLTGSHYFDILHDRLIKGYSLVESAYMGISQLSWQNVVIGDPLYRPYVHLDGTGVVEKEDRIYRASRMAFKLWGDDKPLLIDKMRTAGIKGRDARYFEIMGLYRRFDDKPKDAGVFYDAAAKSYTSKADKARIALHKIDLLMDAGQKDLAIIQCKAALIWLKDDPAGQAIQAKLNILSPPPPPPAKPNKQTPAKK